jgi:hypothetical protein
MGWEIQLTLVTEYNEFVDLRSQAVKRRYEVLLQFEDFVPK